MARSLILLAGYPATGKSHLLSQLVARHPGVFSTIAPDDIKEEVWDACGFGSAVEKAALEPRVWRLYYQRLEKLLGCGSGVISDYPFSAKQRPRLAELSAHYGYQVLTVRLVGDPELIYARSRARDLAPDRHLGHLVSCYHAGDVLSDRSRADSLIDLETFRERCANRGYNRFELGHLIEVDATRVDAIDFSDLLGRIDRFLEKA